MRTAVVVVLFMNEETKAVIGITQSSTLVRLTPAIRWMASPSRSITPPFIRAPERTKIEPRMMMMSFEKPAKASSTVRTPLKTRTESRSRVVTSTGSHSKANTITTVTRRARTRRIDGVIWRTLRVCTPSANCPRLSGRLDNRPASPYSHRPWNC
jgi:hypothetical protein